MCYAATRVGPFVFVYVDSALIHCTVSVCLSTYVPTYECMCVHVCLFVCLCQISFLSEVLGEFCEEFLWNVGKATEPLRLTIR